MVNMWCALPCDEEGAPLCPKGSVCLDRHCERRCDEGIPGTCAAGERCARVFSPGKTVAICVMGE